MLDLDKIAQGLRETLAKETTESIDRWFQECDNESIQSYLGQGEYCKSKVNIECYCLELKKASQEVSEDNNSTENTYFPFAA